MSPACARGFDSLLIDAATCRVSVHRFAPRGGLRCSPDEGLTIHWALATSREAFSLVVLGIANAQVASKLFLSTRAVEWHLR
jgi:hypothetical protein